LHIWAPSAGLPALPAVHGIARVAPQEGSDTLRMLNELVTTELVPSDTESLTAVA
jgi:hypothetical protein